MSPNATPILLVAALPAAFLLLMGIAAVVR